MITTSVLAEYRNGNCDVKLYRDGTKSRTWDGNPQPILPESVDLKITDYCDAGCPFCHEQSTRRGRHADTDVIFRIVDGLPRGAEIAIGGGDPMSHPDVVAILEGLRDRGLIANLTVNEKHFPQACRMIVQWQGSGLVYGVGVSVKDVNVHEFWKQIMTLPDHLVYHLIAGIADPQALLRLGKSVDRVLVLGYKRFGFGAKCDDREIDSGIDRWRYWIGTILKKVPSVSFDNLAIRQLRIKDVIKHQAWESQYMGDDGQFTMYVDAVREEYAISSTSPRHPVGSRNIGEMFALINP